MRSNSLKNSDNVLPKGALRSKCLSSEQLNGIEYKSEITKDKIASIIKTSKEYQRKTPLAFVRFSDAHNIDEVGRCITYVKLDSIDFKSLRNAFGNPTENISTEYPETRNILDKLILESESFGIENISEENKIYFKKLICGLNNSEGGYCLFGLTENKNKIGLNLSSSDDVDGFVKGIFGCFKDIDGSIRVELNVYPIQDKKLIISVHIKKGDDLRNVKNDGSIYLIKEKYLHVASAKEIQRIIENKSLATIESGIQKRISKIETEIFSITNYLKIIPIIRKMEDYSINLKALTENINVLKDINIGKNELFNLSNVSNNYPNGQNKGNIIYFEHKISPRLDYAYLRYSPPMFKLNLKIHSINEETIYLIPGGAVFYTLKRYPIFTHETAYAIALSCKNILSNKFITCFLKSSLWLWYCLNKYETTDIVLPDIFDKILIPKIKTNIPEEKIKVTDIEEMMDKMLILENDFLIHKTKKNEKDLFQRTEQHNKKIDKLAYDIDKKIYSLFDLSKSDIKNIESFLVNNRIYLPESRNNALIL